MRRIDKSAWGLALLSAGLQILIFPLPNLYMLGWVALAPLLIALLRTRAPDALQLEAPVKLLPATAAQGFLLAYASGVVWYAGTCYWIFGVMRHYGGVNLPAAAVILGLFCLYLAIYHGLFGLLVAWLAAGSRFSRRALLLSPVLWVAVELARTRITGFPWDLLGTTQVDNIPLSRLATATGVYGLSFEIMVVNVAMAAAFLVGREKRNWLLLSALAAAVVLQAGSFVPAPPIEGDLRARLVQANIPILEAADWTSQYWNDTLRDLGGLSRNPPGWAATGEGNEPRLILWPESPGPFWDNDAGFRNAASALARESQSWMLIGTIGTDLAGAERGRPTRIYNSASLVNPSGEWVARYDKIHLVPFGEYLPWRSLFSFAGGLTKEVGEFSAGSSRAPLAASGARLGVFICYESIFPDEIRRLARDGAEVFVNLSNDGWYGDSGAYAQHLKQARMRAVENDRWLLRDTNTGVTAAIDPYGRVVATVPRKLRTTLVAPYGLSNVTTFYTRHGDWFAYLCAIISCVELLRRLLLRPRTEKRHG